MELSDAPLFSKTIPIWFSNQEDEIEVNHILPFLNLDGIEDCGLNEFVFLVKTPIGRAVIPPLGEINDFCAQWDEAIEAGTRFNLMIPADQLVP